MAAQGAGSPLAMVAVGLLLVGFAFKVSAVPFHMWTPDAYQESAAGGDGFHVHGRQGRRLRGVRPRIPLGAGAASCELGRSALAFVAAATMIIGTVVGVAQTNVKRMLAHSRACARRLPAARAALRRRLRQGRVLFYLLTYALTNLGAFGVIGLLEDSERPNDTVTDYAGLWHDHPALAALMTIFMLSLGGFPPMAGFIAKCVRVQRRHQGGYTWLSIIGVLTSVVSVFFYLRIVVMMYMTPSGETIARFPPVPRVAGAALVVSAILIFYLGILPARVLDWAAASISTIF
jgi:NADH-quinone oxidoreductase subunit N